MSSDKNKIVLKKIKDSTHILHPDSKLVLQSSKERIVIGRYVDNEIIPLNDESIELCDKWNFKYDKTFLKSDDIEDTEEAEAEAEAEDNEEEEGEGEEGGDDEGGEEEGEETPVEDTKVNKSEDTKVNKSEDTKVNKSEDTQVNKSDNVQPLLIKFGDDFSKLHLELLTNVSKYEQQYLTKIEELETNLKTRDNELSELKIQHDKLREKFKKMMSEFMENV